MSCRDSVEKVQRHAAGWAMQDLQADIKYQLPCLKSWTKHCCSRKGRGQTFSAVQIQGLSANYWFEAFPSIREPEEKLLPDQHLFHWHALPLDPEPATDITHILVEHPQTASPKLLPQPHLWPPLTSLSSEIPPITTVLSLLIMFVYFSLICRQYSKQGFGGLGTFKNKNK